MSETTQMVYNAYSKKSLVIKFTMFRKPRKDFNIYIDCISKQNSDEK